jgi:predicted RNase H-like nuclease (RuvC/YqgF family)
MSEETEPRESSEEEAIEKRKATIAMLVQGFAELRYRVSEFQVRIEAYLTRLEAMFRDYKSRLASIEARLADMEIRLSSLPPEAESFEGIEGMIRDLNEIGDDLMKIQQQFVSIGDAMLERVN